MTEQEEVLGTETTPYPLPENNLESPPPYWDENGRHEFTEGEENPNGAYVALNLKCGIVTIREGTGRDSQIGGRLAGGNVDNVMPALMHLLCWIDGKKMPPEDWLDLKLSDYARIQAELNEQVGGGN